jgi:hypothetical protein
MIDANQLTWVPPLAACEAMCLCGQKGTAAGCSETRRPDLLGRLDLDFSAALAEVRGLELGLTRAIEQPLPPLPRFVAQVDGTAACAQLVRSTVAVAFGILRRRAGSESRSGLTLAQRIKVGSGTKVGLLLFAKDDILEDLWRRRDRWIPTIASWQPDFVVAPDFSVWDGDPALGGQYNIVRSLRFYEALQRAGIPAIPHLFWGSQRQLDEWSAWLRDNVPPVISMDVQCRGGAQFTRLLTDMRLLRERLVAPTRLLVSGIGPTRDLARLVERWPDVTVTRNYVVEVAKHVDLARRTDGSFARVSSDLTPAELLVKRVEMAETWLEGSLAVRARRAA